MNSPARFLSFAAILLLVSTAAFAQSPYYVLTNDQNTANTATLFNLNPTNGSLTEVTTLQTGGASYSGGFYAAETQVITSDANCIFVADGASPTDIAAFSKATNYSKVGNYSSSSLSGGDNMPMIANSQGTLLYAAYAASFNLAVWNILPDCSLSLANIYGTAPFLGSMTLTHDGKSLLATYEIVKEVGSFTISGSDLIDNGTKKAPLEVTGIVVTNDDSLVIMGTAYSKRHPSNLVTATLPHFGNMQVWKVGPGYSAGSLALSPDGAAGNGCLYIGNSGSGNANQSGVTGVQFTENPLALNYVNIAVSPQADSVGTVETITNTGNGGGVYAAESAGYIGVYAARSNCAVELVKETADPNSTSLFSVTSWVK
jgi:hypothetical protein